MCIANINDVIIFMINITFILTESMEGFAEGTVVITNRRCPSWAITKAGEWQLPLLSTTWVVQCLIEGKICPYDSQIRYKYNYIQN